MAFAAADNSDALSIDSSIDTNLLLVLVVTADRAGKSTGRLMLYSLKDYSEVGAIEFAGFEGVRSLQMNVML